MLGLVTSLAFCCGVTLAYVLRPDRLAAVTLFPPWVWAIPGLAIPWICRRRATRSAAVIGGAWLVYLLAMADRPAALVGMFYRDWPAATWTRTSPGRRLRVVTLNCGQGGLAAAHEAAALKPQLILLQESPGGEAVARFTKETFGPAAGYLAGVDVSIVADGQVTASGADDRFDDRARHAHLVLTNGIELEVVSLRLATPAVRIDLWSPDCWRAQADHRRLQREQITRIASRLTGIDPAIPLLVGGDFNTPPGDAIFAAFGPRLRDAFAEGGLGWGNTITNHGPFTRIDQIWISDHWSAETVISRPTIHSDHRMVVVDLILRAPDAGRRLRRDGNGQLPKLPKLPELPELPPFHDFRNVRKVKRCPERMALSACSHIGHRHVGAKRLRPHLQSGCALLPLWPPTRRQQGHTGNDRQGNRVAYTTPIFVQRLGSTPPTHTEVPRHGEDVGTEDERRA